MAEAEIETCSQCGTEIPPGANGCPACGFGAATKLKLVGASGELSTAIDLQFTKAMGSRICGPDAKFMDDVQFFLKTRDEKWFIKPYPRVKNPVYLNGSEISSEVELSTGDKISLKDKAAFIDVSCI